MPSTLLGSMQELFEYCSLAGILSKDDIFRPQRSRIRISVVQISQCIAAFLCDGDGATTANRIQENLRCAFHAAEFA